MSRAIKQAMDRMEKQRAADRRARELMERGATITEAYKQAFAEQDAAQAPPPETP